LGRYLNDASRAEVNSRCSTGHDLQIVIGDGLSVTAVAMQIPRLLPLLCEGAHMQGWSMGSIFVIRYCRVGILNDIGRVANAQSRRAADRRRAGVESLSAYMAYRPKASDTDADRTLISNIHGRGVTTEYSVQ
jgi:ethanolamine ammonia-lyase small subunit